MNRKEVMDYF